MMKCNKHLQFFSFSCYTSFTNICNDISILIPSCAGQGAPGPTEREKEGESYLVSLFVGAWHYKSHSDFSPTLEELGCIDITLG